MQQPSLPPRYEHATQVGYGGMGDIYKARDTELGRWVAIKVLADRYSDDPAVRERFKREATTAASVSNHPNVVTIYDVGEWEERPFIVMAYMAAGTLADRLKTCEGPLPEDEALSYLRAAASALDEAHERGIVHRDVKPANLLMDEAGSLHVGDFGIARVADESTAGLTLPGTVIGTAGYLSPEQARGETSTAASDRYSLAVVAFELLTGDRPFRRESPTAEAAAHVQEPVPSASTRNSQLEPAVDDVLERALAKNPDDRYPSAQTFVHALEEALHPQQTRVMEAVPGIAAPTSGRESRQTQRRSRRWALGLLAALALGAVSVVTAALLTNDRANERQQAAPAEVKTVTKKTAPRTRTIVQTVPEPRAKKADTNLSSSEAAALNDQAYALMNQGRYGEALPMLERAVPALRGAGITEAYASYNLAASLIALDRCDEALPHLDRSEQIQGRRSEIDAARRKCDSGTRGGDG